MTKSRTKANDGWRTTGRVATERRLGAGRVGSQARIRLVDIRLRLPKSSASEETGSSIRRDDAGNLMRSYDDDIG